MPQQPRQTVPVVPDRRAVAGVGEVELLKQVVPPSELTAPASPDEVFLLVRATRRMRDDMVQRGAQGIEGGVEPLGLTPVDDAGEP